MEVIATLAATVPIAFGLLMMVILLVGALIGVVGTMLYWMRGQE